MRIVDWLLRKEEEQGYNPGDDPLISERVDIGFRAERILRIVEDVQRRSVEGRFPILLDEPVETPRW